MHPPGIVVLALTAAVAASGVTAPLAFRVGLGKRSGAWLLLGAIALASAAAAGVTLLRVLTDGFVPSTGEALAWPVLSLVISALALALWIERRRLERHRASVRNASARRLRAGAQQRRVADDLRRSLGDLQRELDEERQAATRNSRDRIELERVSETLRERLRLVGIGASAGIWSVDLISRSTYFSPRFNAIVGLPAEERIGTLDEWLDRVHTDDREPVRAALSAPVADGPTQDLEHRLRHADGPSNPAASTDSRRWCAGTIRNAG